MSPSTLLTRFVLEKMDAESIRTRITLVRALAQVAPSDAERNALNNHADELEAIERSHRQLVLDFNRRSAA